MTASINELKSYTEYNVSTPTSVFTIGFQYEYNVDHVNVYVDGVEATAAGYTIQHDSHGTISLTPAVPTGVVRVSRETDIDSSAHTFSAGAKFTAGNMDENFQQIRHSQQEVRDGFVALEQNTAAGIAAVYQAASDAQTAATTAQSAADTATASEAAIRTIVVDGKVSANAVVDASGKTQQEINDLTGAPYRVKAGGYNIGERVVLENGDIVQSTVAGNTVDPNADMTGWVKTGEITVSSIAKLLTIPNPSNGSIANVLSYREPILSEVTPYKGGGRFVYDAAKSAINDGVLCFNGWVRVKNYTEINPYMAGCVGDGTTDDSDNFQKLITVSKGSFTIGDNGFFLITKPVGWPTNLLQSIGDGTPNATRAYKMKVTGYGATILVKSAEAIFTSERSLADPLSTQDLYTSKIEFNGLKFRGDSTASVVFNGDRLYNTKVVGCEFIRCTKVLHSHINRGVGHPNGYIQSFSFLKNDFLLCNRIVDAKRAYNFRFIENDCEANFGGIYIDGDGDPALNACRINDNLFEGAGLFAKLGAMLGCSIKGNYLEGNNQYDAAALKCHIYMLRVGTGGYTSGCVIEGNAFHAVASQKTDVDWADIKYSTALHTIQDTVAQPILLANWSNSYSLISRNTITTQIGNGSANLQRSAIPELHVQKRVDYKIRQQTFLSSTHLSAGVHTVAELDVAQVRALISQTARAQTADLNILIQCVSASGVPVGSAVAKISLIVHGDESVGTGAVNDVYVGAVLNGFAEIPEGSLINSLGDTFKSHFTSPAVSLTRSGDVYQVKLSGYATKPNPNYGAATQIKSSCTLIGFGFNSGANLLPQLKLV